MKVKITKKDIKEFIILGVIALGCLLYIGFRKSGEINYILPSFPEIATDDFTALEILSPTGDILRMDKSGGQWLLSDNYPADPVVIDRILDVLAVPVPVDIVSESEKYGRYELDEEGRYILKGYRKENLVREIHLGKVSTSEKYNYVLFPGNTNVYTIRGTLIKTVTKEPETFRDKLVLEINRGAVFEINYSAAGTDNLLLIKGEDSVWKDMDGNDWATEKIDELLGRFTSLRAIDFPDDTLANAEEIAVITLKGETESTITLYEKNDKGYPATSSAYPFPVIISTYIGDNVLEGFSGE